MPVWKIGWSERGKFTGENSACIIITNTKLLTKKCYWIFRGVWLCLLLPLSYTKIQLLTIEKELFKLRWLNWITSCSSWEASKIITSKTNRWIIMATDYQTWPGFWPAGYSFFDTLTSEFLTSVLLKHRITKQPFK